jgi:hypothetical protein
MERFISKSYGSNPPSTIRYLKEILCHAGALESSNQHGNVKEDGSMTNKNHATVTVLERS